VSTIYTPEYYSTFQTSSRSSAQVIVPRVMEWFSPSSVIDLGCGMGEWLATFQATGVTEIQGVDGDYVDRNQLAIPEFAFKTHNFIEPYSGNRRYDLAMSVEVAEHLDPEHGTSLVHSLTELSDIVLFSAAAPHQPGRHHVNCQWPVYWSRLFSERGHVAIDAIRPQIWSDSRVDWWYRQNLLLYVLESRLPGWPFLKVYRRDEPMALVHPEMLARIIEWGAETEQKYWDLWKLYEHKNSAGLGSMG
jgi:SAM-dependent methyltransferase